MDNAENSSWVGKEVPSPLFTNLYIEFNRNGIDIIEKTGDERLLGYFCARSILADEWNIPSFEGDYTDSAQEFLRHYDIDPSAILELLSLIETLDFPKDRFEIDPYDLYFLIREKIDNYPNIHSSLMESGYINSSTEVSYIFPQHSRAAIRLIKGDAKSLSSRGFLLCFFGTASNIKFPFGVDAKENWELSRAVSDKKKRIKDVLDLRIIIDILGRSSAREEINLFSQSNDIRRILVRWKEGGRLNHGMKHLYYQPPSRRRISFK